MSYRTLILKEMGSWTEVSLNRPEVHNALNSQMISELTEVFKKVSVDNKNLKVLVLKGEGKSFSAGADLQYMKHMKTMSVEENTQESEKLYEMFNTIQKCSLPVITKVQGSVYGGGLGLLAVSDIVVAHKDTQFCFSECRLGLVPSVISSFILPKIGFSRSLDLMMSAINFTAPQAYEWGLIHGVGEMEEIEDFVLARIDAILQNGPESVQATKLLIKKYLDSYVDKNEFREYTTKLISERRVSLEGQEGMTAFLEKRKPSWRTNR